MNKVKQVKHNGNFSIVLWSSFDKTMVNPFVRSLKLHIPVALLFLFFISRPKVDYEAEVYILFTHPLAQESLQVDIKQKASSVSLIVTLLNVFYNIVYGHVHSSIFRLEASHKAQSGGLSIVLFRSWQPRLKRLYQCNDHDYTMGALNSKASSFP